MAKKCMCIKTCYRMNPAGKWRPYEVGEVEWWDECPKHFEEVKTGEPMTALEILQARCQEIGLRPEKTWDIARCQREYDNQMAKTRSEQDKSVMGKTVGDTDARVHPGIPEKSKKGI